MNGLRAILLVLALVLAGAVCADAADQPLFGPEKYDVKERYGRQNKYTAEFAATEELYLIKLQNGEQPAERTDILQLSVNGREMVLEKRYPFEFIAIFTALQKENRIEVMIADEKPAGFRRPRSVPKNVILTVLPAPAGTRHLRGSFGLFTWDGLKAAAAVFQGIKNPAAATLAMEGASLHLSAVDRAEAVRELSDLKERSAEDYLVRTYGDPYAPPEVRAESALAIAVLGNTRHVPALAQGILDPDSRISMASSRGLSFYPEEVTGPHLVRIIEKLDNLRKGSTVRAVVEAGWKPIGTLITLADSEDARTADIAINILGSLRDRRATDHLLALLQAPKQDTIRSVIRALGETSDPRAFDPLFAMASDPAQRSSREVDLADALAALGDRRAAPVIGQMIKKAPSPQADARLRSAYWKLTGKNY